MQMKFCIAIDEILKAILLKNESGSKSKLNPDESIAILSEDSSISAFFRHHKLNAQ